MHVTCRSSLRHVALITWDCVPCCAAYGRALRGVRLRGRRDRAESLQLQQVTCPISLRACTVVPAYASARRCPLLAYGYSDRGCFLPAVSDTDIGDHARA
eukprot:3916325-Rhodomonas_salina.2